MSRLQENGVAEITALMDRIGLRYHPSELGISRPVLRDSLLALKSYTEAAGLWYSIIQERDIDEAWIEEALAGLRF
jgi:hypothetical protein